MSDNEQSVMIALLPTTSEWCHIELPHLTLVYAGQIKDLNPTTFNEMGKTVLELARQFGPQTLDVERPDIFGGRGYDEKVDVLILQKTPDISAMRMSVDHWNASEFPFTPHVTVGPVGSLDGDVPSQIRFDKIKVAWGDRGISCRFAGAM